MEGVGARFGRTSSRYGPTTVFTGPVRKWKKKWIHVTPPSSGNNNSNHQTAVANGNNGGSHLLLFKWTPITASQNNNGNNGNNKIDDENNEASKDDDLAAEEHPKRKFKYIPFDSSTQKAKPPPHWSVETSTLRLPRIDPASLYTICHPGTNSAILADFPV